MIPNLLYCKAIGITAGVTARKIGGDTWSSMVFGFFIGTIIFLLFTYLGSKFPEKTVIQYAEELLGKWVGKFIGLLLAVFFAVAYATSANVMNLHLKEYFLPDTPFLVICLAYTLLCMYGVILGIEVIVRFSLVGFIMSLMINITMIFGTIKDFRFINLQPFLDTGITSNILNSTYVFSDIAMAILALGIIYPMLNIKEKSLTLSFWAMVIGAVIVVIWPFFEAGVMSAEAMKKYVVVCMQQIRCAQLTRFLPRYELLMVSFFSFGAYVQSAAMFYCAKYSIKQITGMKKDLKIIIPLTVVLTILTYCMANDHNDYINFLSYPWAQISAALSIGLPIILFFTALLKGQLKAKST